MHMNTLELFDTGQRVSRVSMTVGSTGLTSRKLFVIPSLPCVNYSASLIKAETFISNTRNQAFITARRLIEGIQYMNVHISLVKISFVLNNCTHRIVIVDPVLLCQ